MISEPIEAVIAVVLVTIALATVITYMRVITRQEIVSERVLARSVASVLADLYARDFVMYGNISFQEFRNKVGEICSLTWKRTGVWVNVSMYMIFLNGTEVEFQVNSTKVPRPQGDKIIVMVPVMPRSASSEIHWYCLSYRDSYYVQQHSVGAITWWEGETARFYFVAYGEDGLPIQGGHAQVTVYTNLGELVGTEGANLVNGMCKIAMTMGGSGPAPTKIHVFANYTGPNGESFPTRSFWVDLESGDPYSRGEQHLIVNETAQEDHHFYAGETIYGRTANRMNLTSIRDFLKDLSLPLPINNISLAQGPYNASIINGFDTSSRANVPFFIFPYTVRIEVEVIAPRG